MKNDSSTCVFDLVTTAIYGTLKAQKHAKSREIARSLGIKTPIVRAAMLVLEAEKKVYRTGVSRGVRWWLKPTNITELVVDQIAAVESAKSIEIALALNLPRYEIRTELRKLKASGIVYRTGAQKGTRWWLG